MIKPVRKVKIIVPKNKKEELLLTLQKEEIVMLPKIKENGVVDTKYEEEVISRVENALKKLSSYKLKARKFFKYETVDYNEFVGGLEERVNLLSEVENKFDSLNFLRNEIKEEEKLISDVIGFKDLKYPTKILNNTRYVSIHYGYVPEKRKDFFNEYCLRDDINYVSYELIDIGYPVLIYLDKDLEDKKMNQLKRFGFNEYYLPELDITISDYIKEKQKLINKNNKKINEIEKSFDEKIERNLKVLADQINAQKDRKEIIYKEDDSDIIFEGWISDLRAGQLQGIVRKITLEYQLEFEEPNEHDEVPTLIKNNKFVTPFESITNTYAIPNYKELDPNPVMSFWYWLIFGIMMGDIGYGLLMVIAFGLYNKFKKPKGSFGQLTKILFYSGFSTMFFGVIFGSLFGADFNLLKIIGNLFGQNWNSSLLDPVNDPMSMLIFSIALGVVHLISGLVMRVVLSFRRKDYVDAISKGLSWILILTGLALFAANMGLKLETNILQTIAIVLIALGVLSIIVVGGLKKSGVFGKVFGGIGGLYSITNYLSDLLSYSRILALALSSGIIAYTMNLLAGLIQTGVIGYLLSFVVYIIGHTFNFAIGLLSAYVHDGRLQYLEFFGKFYEGGGYLFEPLRFNTKYMNEITN